MQKHLATLIGLFLLASCSSGPAVDRTYTTRDQDSRVKYLVLHYTVFDNQASLKEFTGQTDVRASIHYLVTDGAQPKIYGLVDESRNAWHAGLGGGWKADRAINNTSIGIEIVNRGWIDGPGGKQWFAFPDAQMAVLLPLIADIVKRHHIAPENILGHSDVAPQRKQDPGALFPWQRLVDAGLVAWPDRQLAADKARGFGGQLPDAAWFQKKLAAIGYVVPQDGVWSEASRNVLIAYQTRYRPLKIDGEMDAESAGLLDTPMSVKQLTPL
ncbi:N-acetylmuramoyl-L-alanine amidase [Massilia sp. S19_KUP03_FR1]|uniref:N-acetylmuramoyl-L-alanine amidase n=1 Tax=Massilia sp. S19_KUP03_FR1 TaxID=3025503 RepID=UPI002FCD0059